MLLTDEPAYIRDENGKFLPGTSGGPGRPRGSVSIVTALKKYLKEHPDEEEKVARVLIDAALERDMRAMAMLLDRTDGPVKAQEQNDDFEAPPREVVKTEVRKDERDK